MTGKRKKLKGTKVCVGRRVTVSLYQQCHGHATVHVASRSKKNILSLPLSHSLAIRIHIARITLFANYVSRFLASPNSHGKRAMFDRRRKPTKTKYQKYGKTEKTRKTSETKNKKTPSNRDIDRRMPGMDGKSLVDTREIETGNIRVWKFRRQACTVDVQFGRM